MISMLGGIELLETPGRNRVSTGVSAFERRMLEMDMAAEELGSVNVLPGTGLRLTTDPRAVSALAPRLRVTGGIEEYKRWIGRPDEEAGPGNFWQAPEPWNGRAAQSLDDLSSAEQTALENAGRIYLFGDSRRVKSYAALLEALKAPFMAAVYAARRVHIHPGASLTVDGAPAILLFEHLIIEDGGALATYTPTHATFALLEKREGFKEI